MTNEIGSRAWFQQYLDAFNEARPDDYGAYYHEDLEFLGRAFTLTGRKAVVDHYKMIRTRIDEHIGLETFVGSPEVCAAEIITTLDPSVDWPDFPTGPLEVGVRKQSINFLFYHIEDGKFRRIRAAGFRHIS